jgi:hypothetical protein
MKKYLYLVVSASALILASCGSGKTYFTPEIRTKIETNSIQLTSVQFYVDRDIELTRVLESGQTHVTAGSVKFENGQYVNVIQLKKFTPGVCTMVTPNSLSISFEVGNNTYLNFGRTRAGTEQDPYRILADSWVSDYGLITYEGKQYHIDQGGNAAILITTKWLNTKKVDVREMKGRTVDGTTPKSK